jgi:hypothetical protein
MPKRDLSTRVNVRMHPYPPNKPTDTELLMVLKGDPFVGCSTAEKLFPLSPPLSPEEEEEDNVTPLPVLCAVSTQSNKLGTFVLNLLTGWRVPPVSAVDLTVHTMRSRYELECQLAKQACELIGFTRTVPSFPGVAEFAKEAGLPPLDPTIPGNVYLFIGCCKKFYDKLRHGDLSSNQSHNRLLYESPMDALDSIKSTHLVMLRACLGLPTRHRQLCHPYHSKVYKNGVHTVVSQAFLDPVFAIQFSSHAVE